MMNGNFSSVVKFIIIGVTNGKYFFFYSIFRICKHFGHDGDESLVNVGQSFLEAIVNLCVIVWGNDVFLSRISLMRFLEFGFVYN